MNTLAPAAPVVPYPRKRSASELVGNMRAGDGQVGYQQCRNEKQPHRIPKPPDVPAALSDSTAIVSTRTSPLPAG